MSNAHKLSTILIVLACMGGFAGCTTGSAFPAPRLQIDVSALSAPLAPPSPPNVISTQAKSLQTEYIALTREPSSKPTKAKPSAYSWNPGKSKKGPVTVMVSLSDQKAYVYRDGVRIAYTKVSTGKRGYETPTGNFSILQKKKAHKSNLYEDGDMPYMQRLTWDGIALHGGRVPNYPASHGCIRFPHNFARKLYGITGIGSRVVVADYHPGDERI